jgi:transcription antitermination protein NusB
MGPRRQGREGALRALFFLDLNPELTVGEALRRFFELWAEGGEVGDAPSGEAREFCERLVRGTWAHRDEIDALLRHHSQAWRIERMATVDRNVLRLCVFELRFGGDVPKAVALDEAVELAKKYGSDGSAAFVNGVLDRIAAGGDE